MFMMFSRKPSQGEPPGKKKQCSFCQGHDHDSRTCSAKKAFGRLIGGAEKVRECVVLLPRNVQVMPHCPLIPMLSEEECVLQLCAVAVPDPVPDQLEYGTMCSIATFSLRRLGPPSRVGVATWGSILSWCNHLKSSQKLLFAKCA